MSKLIKYDRTYYNVALSYCWKELFFAYNLYNLSFNLIIFRKKPKHFYFKMIYIIFFNLKFKSFLKNPIKILIQEIKSFILGISHSLNNKVTIIMGSYPNFMYKCGVIFTLPILFVYNPKLFFKEIIKGFYNKFAFFKKL